MPYSEDFQDILEGIDEAQLLAEIGEEELARQADMLDLLEKKEATVEDGQLVRAPAPNTPHRSQPAHTPHSHTPHSHTPLTPRTPFRIHSSSTLTEGGLSKFFKPGSEERRVTAIGEEQLKADEEDGGGQDSDEEEPFDCSAEVSYPCTCQADARSCRMTWMGSSSRCGTSCRHVWRARLRVSLPPLSLPTSLRCSTVAVHELTPAFTQTFITDACVLISSPLMAGSSSCSSSRRPCSACTPRRGSSSRTSSQTSARKRGGTVSCSCAGEADSSARRRAHERLLPQDGVDARGDAPPDPQDVVWANEGGICHKSCMFVRISGTNPNLRRLARLPLRYSPPYSTDTAMSHPGCMTYPLSGLMTASACALLAKVARNVFAPALGLGWLGGRGVAALISTARVNPGYLLSA